MAQKHMDPMDPDPDSGNTGKNNINMMSRTKNTEESHFVGII
jgi:hypothetical protein